MRKRAASPHRKTTTFSPAAGCWWFLLSLMTLLGTWVSTITICDAVNAFGPTLTSSLTLFASAYTATELLTALAYIYFAWMYFPFEWIRRGTRRHIFFQDVADADNFASLAAYIMRYGTPTPEEPLFFVLSRRPENLSVPKFFPGCGFTFPGVVSSTPQKSCEKDSLLVGEISVVRLVSFLHNYCGVGSTLEEAYHSVHVFDGGSTNQSPNLKHEIHARDAMFWDTDTGCLTTPEKYAQMNAELNGAVGGIDAKGCYNAANEPEHLKKARRQRCANFIKHANQTFVDEVGVQTLLRPLSELLDYLDSHPSRDIVAIVLAPLTGLANLFKLDKKGILKNKLVGLFGQLFAWDNCAPVSWKKTKEAKNILKNQFNVDCDTVAVEEVLEWLPQCKKLKAVVLVPTEVIKTDEQANFYKEIHQELQGTPFDELPPVAALLRQWNAVKGNQPQFMFDQLVIFLMYQMEKDGYNLNCSNSFFEMVSADVRIHENQEIFSWDRPVFHLYETYTCIWDRLMQLVLWFKPRRGIGVRIWDVLMSWVKANNSITIPMWAALNVKDTDTLMQLTRELLFTRF